MKRIFTVSVLVLGSVVAVACGGSVEGPQTTASAVSKAPIGANTHGAVKMIGEALGDVALRPEQRSEIEKLATDAEARHQPMVDGRKDLMLALADQVETGAIDRAALQPKLDRVGADMEKGRTDDRAALVRLHELLDKQQRNDFADALEKQAKGKRGGRDQDGPGVGMRGLGHLKQLADELKLSDDQKSKIHDVIKESFKEGMKERREGRGHGKGERRKHRGNPIDAFREDKLDLPTLDAKKLSGQGAERVEKVAAQIVPILTPEQRKLAADKLRAMANEGNASLIVH